MALIAYVYHNSKRIKGPLVDGIQCSESRLVITVEDIVQLMQEEKYPVLIDGFDLHEGTISLFVMDK